MEEATNVLFGPFRLDITNQRLWRDGEEVVLSPKPFAMLCHLVKHPGRLVTKEELFEAVWSDTHVTTISARVCLHEIRRALNEDFSAPAFIETIPRRGYRFIAPVTAAPAPGHEDPARFGDIPAGTSLAAPRFSEAPRAVHSQPPRHVVGRELELRLLHDRLEAALRGERQIVFVTGEPGIGKTTLVDAFLGRLGTERAGAARSALDGGAPSAPLVARGQCIEHYAASEAYLPVLEALGRLCRGPDAETVLAILRRYAPLWVAQLPSVLTPPERETLLQQVTGTTQDRMLREMAEAVEAITEQRPLVLWLEDLHGTDFATLDLLAFLARRRESARLLLLGTYRPLAVRTGRHPLYAVQRELQVRGQCHELALEPLSKEAVAEYLATRFAPRTGESPLREVARIIHERTEGNPLFIVSTAEALLGRDVRGEGADLDALRGRIAEACRSVPANLRQFIEQQIDGLPAEEQELLEAASVAGVECSAATIAAAMGESVEAIEQRCVPLVRREQFLHGGEGEEWPDGTVAARYRFVHALHQEVLYERVTVARRAALHRRIGERLEAGYGDRSGEVATPLAMHFSRGRDHQRAVHYLQLAGQTAMARHAPREAEALLTTGIALLQALPETPARHQQELMLHVALGPALAMTRGYADPEVERVYLRARELCRQMGETPQHLFPVLQGLWMFFFVRAEHRTAHDLGRRLLRLAERSREPALLAQAHQALGVTLHFLGDVDGAQGHLEQGMALYDPRRQASSYGDDPAVMCLTTAAVISWLRGYPDQALAQAEEALALARKRSHPLNLGTALFSCAFVSQHRDRSPRASVRKRIEEAVRLSESQGLPLQLAIARMLEGSVESPGGLAAVERMRQALTAYETTGARCLQPYFLALLAGAYDAMERPQEGLAVLDEALKAVDETEERFYEAELWRLKGALIARLSRNQTTRSDGRRSRSSRSPDLSPSPGHAEAETCFRKAIEVARRQNARSVELRAVIGLAHLRRRQGKTKQARRMLAEVYGRFTEGFETADLKEAEALLAELS